MKNMTLIATVAGAAVVLSACSGASNPASIGDDAPLVNGQTFALAIPTDPGTLDPALSISSDATQVHRFLYDTLTRVGAEGTDLPNLAAEWTATLTKATFTLRPDITCGDGSPLTASTVAENFNFIADEESSSPLLGFVVPTGTKAVADDAEGTVTITSPEPDAFLLRNLSSVPIVCDQGLEDRSRLTNGADGTGMFTLESRSSDGELTLVRRDDYTWGPGDFDPEQDGLPDRVTIRTVESPSTSANLLISGDINAAKVTGPDAQRAEAAGLQLETYPSVAGQMFFNEDPARALSSEEVRRALVTGIDLADLRKLLTGGNGEASAGMVPVEPPVCPGSPAEGAFPEFDANEARTLLDEAGWTGDEARTRDGEALVIKVLYPAGAGAQFDAAMEFVKSSWEELGVSVELVSANDSKLYQILDDTGDWDVSFVTLGFTLPSQMIPFLSGPAAPDGLNAGHVDNEEYLEAAQSALQKPGTEGCDDWNAAEETLYSRVDVVPFASELRKWFLRRATFDLVHGVIDPTSIRMRG